MLETREMPNVSEKNELSSTSVRMLLEVLRYETLSFREVFNLLINGVTNTPAGKNRTNFQREELSKYFGYFTAQYFSSIGQNVTFELNHAELLCFLENVAAHYVVMHDTERWRVKLVLERLISILCAQVTNRISFQLTIPVRAKRGEHLKKIQPGPEMFNLSQSVFLVSEVWDWLTLKAGTHLNGDNNFIICEQDFLSIISEKKRDWKIQSLRFGQKLAVVKEESASTLTTGLKVSREVLVMSLETVAQKVESIANLRGKGRRTLVLQLIQELNSAETDEHTLAMR
jgi:hypothetical protein